MKRFITSKKSKNLLTLVVSGLLAVSLITTGCSGQNNRNNQNTSIGSEDTKPDENAQSQKHLELTWMGFNEPGYNAVPDTEVQRMVEKEFNVTIKLVQIDRHNKEQYALLLAGGTYPDAIMGNPVTLKKQGVIRSIDTSLLYEYMPTWMKTMEELVTKEFLDVQLYLDGEGWGIPYSTFANQVSRLGIIRKDWLDNVGISKVPETVDEFGEMLNAFTFKDPDGNKKEDTFGWHFLPTNYVAWGHYIMGAFGIQPDSFYLENDQVIYTSITEEYKNALETLSAWYKKGYIDPEFITDTRDVQRSKWSEGMFGYLEDAAGWVSSGLMATNLRSMVLDKNPDAKFIIMPAIKGPKGKSGGRLEFPNIQSDNSYCFGMNASDEKVIRIMQIYEKCTADWDWYMRMTYGKEGEHWSYKDGVLQTNPDVTIEERTNLGLRLFSGLTPLGFEAMPKLYQKEGQEDFKVAIDNPKSYSGISPFLDKNNQLLTENRETISTIAQQFTVNAVTGKSNIDDLWDQYVKDIMNAGCGQVIEELQATYNKSAKR